MNRIRQIMLSLMLVAGTTVSAQDIAISLGEYVAQSGAVKYTAGYGVENAKNGNYLIYQVTVTESGIYDAYALCGTANSGSSVAIDMDVRQNTLTGRDVEACMMRDIAKGKWSDQTRYDFQNFRLTAGQTYYLRVYFKCSSTYCANVFGLGLAKAADQTTEVCIDVDIEKDGNTLYANSFEGPSVYPFWRGWAWAPNYISVEIATPHSDLWSENGYAEFYYNQAALDADNRRERRGAELTCDFTTVNEGWYGFRFYLPEGKFPKNLEGSIITQIFNRGKGNSWAGHLSITDDKLLLSYRRALVAPTVKEVGIVQWNQWIPVIMYFKAGLNGKGRIRVWMGDDMQESNPTLDTNNISFGFGDWVDNETMDASKGTSLGCKFGLYVSEGGDRTIRMDDISALEGNPEGAFETVKPTLDTTPTGIETVHGEGFMVHDSVVYDLQGRRVAQPTKGLYIVNGKKIVK